MRTIHHQDHLLAVCRSLRIDPEVVRRMRNAFYKRSAEIAAVLDLLPDAVRMEFATQVRFEFLELLQHQDSTRDGATKLAFRTWDGQMIESVILRIRSGRTSLCVSTQAGCAAGCRFCATGAQGLIRDLTADEILDQVAQVNRLLRRELTSTGAESNTPRRASNLRPGARNVVFMGMGEPFHNESNLYAALDVLLSPAGFHMSPQKLMISTIGVPDAMERCATRFPQIRLAVSLHSANETARRELMPLTAQYPLPRLRTAMRQAAASNGGIMVEYLLLQGVNDTPADVTALTSFLAGIPVHINLIPLNSTPLADGLANVAETHRQAFARELRAAGFKVTLRYSLGADIAAACGQLAAPPPP